MVSPVSMPRFYAQSVEPVRVSCSRRVQERWTEAPGWRVPVPVAWQRLWLSRSFWMCDIVCCHPFY